MTVATYVVGDIHGCYSEFMQLIDKIESQDSDARFILVGDIIDRGYEQIEMLEWALVNVNKPDGRFQMIMGNHEYEKIKFFKNCLDYYESEGCQYWYEDHYRFDRVMRDANLSIEKIRDIYQFIKSLPEYIQYECRLGNHKQNYIIVHGDIPRHCLNKDETIRKRAFTEKARHYYGMSGRDLTSEIVWERNECGHPELRKTIVIHGHTPTLLDWIYSRPGMINFLPHDINVDCGITFRKEHKEANLAAIRLEDLEEFYLFEPEPQSLEDDEEDFKAKMIKRPRRKKEDSCDDIFDLDSLFEFPY